MIDRETVTDADRLAFLLGSLTLSRNANLLTLTFTGAHNVTVCGPIASVGEAAQILEVVDALIGHQRGCPHVTQLWNALMTRGRCKDCGLRLTKA